MLEHEVKLAFDDAESARARVVAAGGRLIAARRLIDDRLFDYPDGRLRANHSSCRVRRDGDRAWLAFKGPPVPGPVKTREEIETAVGRADLAEALLGAIGLAATFRSQKYREEYSLESTTVAVDETPIGVFVEIEGLPDAIDRAAGRLGRTRADYRLESYPRLYLQWREARDLAPGDMVFP